MCEKRIHESLVSETYESCEWQLSQVWSVLALHVLIFLGYLEIYIVRNFSLKRKIELFSSSLPNISENIVSTPPP